MSAPLTLVHIPPEVFDNQECRAVIDFIEQCSTHILYHPNEELDLLDRFTPHLNTWRDRFNEVNRELDITCTSVSDYIFVTYCYVDRCLHIPPPNTITDDLFFNLLWRLRWLACAHTLDTHNAPLNAWKPLFHECTAFIAEYMYDYNDEFLLNLVTPCEHRRQETNDMIEQCKALLWLKPLRSIEEEKEEAQRKLKQLEEINYFESKDDRDILQREYDEHERIRLEMIAKEEDDTSQRGSLFNGDPRTQIRTFIALTSRVFRTLHLHEAILNTFPHRTLPSGSITDKEREAVKTWMIRMCRMERTTKFLNMVRDMSYEECVPLGGRLISSRRMAGDFPPATSMLEIHLGVDTAMSVMETAEQEITKISENEHHLLYPYLLLGMFEIIFETHVARSFMKDHHIATHVIEDSPIRALYWRLFRRVGIGSPRPIVFRLNHIWWIWNNKTWIQCRDMIEVLLTWNWIVRNEFDSQISTGQKIKVITELFTPATK